MPGIYAITPMLPGTIAFGMAFGALCAQKNFTLTEVQVMMAFVYGGLSQFVAVSSPPGTLTASSIATLALLTATVNIRFSLMSASLRPWFGTLPWWQSYPSMLLVTDGGWLAATRYRNHGGADAWFFVAGGILLYVLLIRLLRAGIFARGAAQRSEEIRRRSGGPGVLCGDACSGLEGATPRDPVGCIGDCCARGTLAGAGLVVHHRRCCFGRHQRRPDG